MLPPAIETFASRYPSVTIELLTGTRLYSVAHREADLAFRIVPFDEADVVQRRLVGIVFSVYAPADRPLVLDEGGRHLALIEDEPKESSLQQSWLRERFPGARTVLRVNNRTIQARMAAAGVGLAMLPRRVGDAVPELRRIDLGETPPVRDVWMGYHRDLRTLRRPRAFVEIVAKSLANN